MKTDYTILDAAIISALEAGDKKFNSIFLFHGVSEEARRLTAMHNEGRPARFHKDDFRFVDSRLQALRRAGKIFFIDAKRGWAIT